MNLNKTDRVKKVTLMDICECQIQIESAKRRIEIDTMTICVKKREIREMRRYLRKLDKGIE